jgi:murein DD-endopeptidase MepM/ murein hydrolase activator NlpD
MRLSVFPENIYPRVNNPAKTGNNIIRKNIISQNERNDLLMMRNLKDTRLGILLGGKGAYITLAGVLALSVAAGAVAYGKAINSLETPPAYEGIKNADSNEIVRAADKKQTDVPREKPGTVSSTVKPAEKPRVTEEPKTTVPDTQPNVMPVNGEILAPYSGGALVKSETTGVWKTHDGIDIKADRGTAVKAMNKGEVTQVREDPLWGYTVIIDHGSGIMGYYYNLSSAVAVKEGDMVQSGQTIGAVGDSAEIESAMPSHLHFGLKRNGSWIDPLDYIAPIGRK